MSLQEFGKVYYFVAIWDGAVHGTKGAFMSKVTGKIKLIRRKAMSFYDTKTLEKMGVTTIRGKRRNNFLKKFGWKINHNNKTVVRM